MNLDEQKKLYLITQNLEYFFASEQKKIREFRVKLSKILFQTIGESLNIVYITHQEILNFLIQHINKETIISLDKWIYSSFIKEKVFLEIDITRYYEWNNLEQSIIDSQYMYKSSSSESLEKQIVSIKNKLNKEWINSVYLWDDWKFSWWSIKVIIELLA